MQFNLQGSSAKERFAVPAHETFDGAPGAAAAAAAFAAAKLKDAFKASE